MFDFENVVDQTAKYSKQAFVFVQNKDFRDSLETVIDAQADFSKTMYNTSLEMAKQLIETSKNFNFANASTAK
jgi:5,10-methenyltetrahydromethanopterin hydrogenase